MLFCEKKSDRFLIILKATSWDTDLWETLGDYMYGKNSKFEREIYI